MYCNRSCLCVCDGRAGSVCYHDNPKLRASIFTKLGLWVKVVTISSWLNFGRPAPPGKGSTAGRNFLAPRYYGKRAVFASLRALFSFKSRRVAYMWCRMTKSGGCRQISMTGLGHLKSVGVNMPNLGFSYKRIVHITNFLSPKWIVIKVRKSIFNIFFSNMRCSRKGTRSHFSSIFYRFCYVFTT